MINIKNKYNMFKYDVNKDKISIFVKGNSMTEINENSKNKKIDITNVFVMIRLEETKWTPTTKIPINMLGGPIKILFSFYHVTPKFNIKKNKDDPRAIQYLYYTYDYYVKNKIKMDDLNKIAHLAILNKLEKRPLAQKLITQYI